MGVQMRRFASVAALGVITEVNNRSTSSSSSRDSHKPISEKRKSRNRGSTPTKGDSRSLARVQHNCQVMNCYYIITIYIPLLVQLIAQHSNHATNRGAQATSHISSIWVTSDRELQHENQLAKQWPAAGGGGSSSKSESGVSLGSSNSSTSRGQQEVVGRKLFFDQMPTRNTENKNHQLRVTSSTGQKWTAAPDSNSNKGNKTQEQDGNSRQKSNRDHKPAMMSASASSLQASVVAAEPEPGQQEPRGQQQRQQQAQRRSSQSFTSAGVPHFKLAHLNTSLSDEASSLDDLWSGAQQRAHRNNNNNSNHNNQTSNEQVHFDEEQQQQQLEQQSRRRQLIPKPIEDYDVTSRHDNATTLSNLAPKHVEFHPEDEIHFDEPASHMNRTRGDGGQAPEHRPVVADDDLDDSLQPSGRNFSSNTQHGGGGGSSDQPGKGPDSVPGVYYLPDGDKWNMDSPPDHDQHQITTREPAGLVRPGSSPASHNYPFDRELHQQHRIRGSPGEQVNFTSHYHQSLPDPNTIYHLNGMQNELQLAHQPKSGRHDSTDDSSIVRPGSSALPASLSFGSVLSNGRPTAGAPMGHRVEFPNEAQQTYSLVKGQPSLSTVPYFTYQAQQLEQQPPLASKVAPPIGHHSGPIQTSPPATSRPQSLHQILGSGHYDAFTQPTSKRSRPPSIDTRNQIVHLGEVPQLGGSGSVSGSTRSFLRNYNPIQLIGGGGGIGAKSKKSFLSTINDKLNHWTSESSQLPSRNEMRLLESAFFDQSPAPGHRSARPSSATVGAYLRPNGFVRPSFGMHQSSGSASYPNRYPAMDFQPMSFYGPIRQPTVAPASSTLNSFYGSSSSNYNRRPASVHLKQRRQNSGNGGGQAARMRGIQHQGSKQPTSFIPVVAVQVTRTSPAPTPMQGQHNQQSKLHQLHQEQQQQQFGYAQNYHHQQASANEIDQYLASKVRQFTPPTGANQQQQQQQAFNANERQKWDDSSYGGTASPSQQLGGVGGHRLALVASPNSRHKLTSGAGGANSYHLQQQQPPQHETTVKGAVFGYLPHQAGAPLMQAMSVLQQLAPTNTQSQSLPTGALSGQGQAAQLHSGPGGDQLDALYASAERDAYANQMDKSSQSADAATSFFDYQSLASASAAAENHQHWPAMLKGTAASGQFVGDDQPSLALQLQANSFVQNDIAHPLLTSAGGSGNGAGPGSANMQLDQRFGQSKVKPLDLVYPTSGQLYPGYQFLTPNQLNAAYQDQLAQMMANPLLAAQNVASATAAGTHNRSPAVGPLDNGPSYATFYTSPTHSSPAAASSQQMLAAVFAPNEMNSALLANGAASHFPQFHNVPQFQAIDSFYDTTSLSSSTNNNKPGNSGISNQPQMDESVGPFDPTGQETSGADSSQQNQYDSNESSQQQQQPPPPSPLVATTETSHRNQALNKGNRKRSGEFFANAGQLLLSALPLLLAPTLGLMFAASPSIPAARYHGLGQQLSGGGNGQGGGGSGVASLFSGGGGPNKAGQGSAAVNYDDGVVMNASPVPQMFTPTPLGNHHHYMSGASDGSSGYHLSDNNNSSSKLNPLGAVTNSNSSSSSLAASNAADNLQPTTTTLPTTTTTSSTTSRPKGLFKSSASLSALTGLSTTPARPSRPSSSRGQATSRPFAVLLTTLGPAFDGHPSAHQASLNRSDGVSNEPELMASANNKSQTLLEEPLEVTNNDTTLLVTPTLLLVETQTGGDDEHDDDDGGNGKPTRGGDGVMQSETSLEADQQQHQHDQNSTGTSHHYSSGDARQRVVNTRTTIGPTTNTTTTSSPSPAATIAYDIGYQGADFDAQFPTLRRVTTRRSVTSTTRPSAMDLNKFVKNKSQYQYAAAPASHSSGLAGAGVPSSSASSSSQSDYEFASVAIGPVVVKEHNVSRHDLGEQLGAGDQHEYGNNKNLDQDYDHPTSKLYPVSTWPPFRRRTVSLITSKGNKTLLNASPPERNRFLNRLLLHKSDDHKHQQPRQEQTGSMLRRRSSKLAAGDRNQWTASEQRQNRKLNSPESRVMTASLQAGIDESDRHRGNLAGRRGFYSGPRRRRRKRETTLEATDLIAKSGSNFTATTTAKGAPIQNTTARAQSNGQVVSSSGKVIRLLKKRKKRKRPAKKSPQHHPKQQQQQQMERRYDYQFGGSPASLSGSDLFATADSRPPDTSLPASALVGEDQHATTGHGGRRQLNASSLHDVTQAEASRRKSAIVTAMITQVATGDGDQDDLGGDLGGGHRVAAESDPEEEAQLAHEELREQLVAKKMLLDRLATRAAAVSNELGDQALAAEEADSFRLGGRGNFKPVPVADQHSSSSAMLDDHSGHDHRLQQNQHNRNYSATRFVSGRSRFGGPRERIKANTIELNEQTKRALAKFGSLLLEDTLQIPGAKNESSGARGSPALNRSKYSLEYQYSKSAGSPPQQQSPASSSSEQQESSATERYPPLRATTRSPLEDNWSHYYRNQTSLASGGGRSSYERDSGRSQDTQAGFVYQYPSSRTRNRSPSSQHHHNQDHHQRHEPPQASNHSAPPSQSLTNTDWDSRYDRFEPARRPSGKQSAADHPPPPIGSINSHAYPAVPGSSSSSSPPSQDEYGGGGGSQAIGFKPANGRQGPGPDSTVDRYNHFLFDHHHQQHANNRTSTSNATDPVELQPASNVAPPTANGDQLDARYSTLSNYSTSSPPLHAYGDAQGMYSGSSGGGSGHYDRYGPVSRRHEQQGGPAPPPGYYQPEESPLSQPHYSYDRQSPHYYPGQQHHHQDHHHQNSSYGGGPAHPAPQNHRQLASSYQPTSYQPNHRHGPPPPPDDYTPPQAASYHQHNNQANYSPSLAPPAPYRPPALALDSRHSSPPPPAPPTRYPGGHPAYEPSGYYPGAYGGGSSSSAAADGYHTGPQQHYHHQHRHHLPSSSTYAPASSSLAPHQTYHHTGGRSSLPGGGAVQQHHHSHSNGQPAGGPPTAADSSRAINDYLKRAQFSDSDRDKLMASYLTCDGLLHDNDHCLERLSCEFSDPKNIEKANKLDRAVSSILLGHILINTYIPNSFKLRLKSASLFGYTQSGNCSKFVCNKLAKQAAPSHTSSISTNDEPKTTTNSNNNNNANNDEERR